MTPQSSLLSAPKQQSKPESPTVLKGRGLKDRCSVEGFLSWLRECPGQGKAHAAPAACRADILVCRLGMLSSLPSLPNWRLESRHNRQPGKAALRRSHSHLHRLWRHTLA